MKKDQKLKRIYYHYLDLEEFHAGMWRITRGDERKMHIVNAANLMRDTDRFSRAMRQALNEWPKSCEHSLSAEATNRIAFLGHAGCCISTTSPEEATRAAWHTLSQKEQDGANEAAALVLYEWEKSKIAERLRLSLNQLDLFYWTLGNAETADRN